MTSFLVECVGANGCPVSLEAEAGSLFELHCRLADRGLLLLRADARDDQAAAQKALPKPTPADFELLLTALEEGERAGVPLQVGLDALVESRTARGRTCLVRSVRDAVVQGNTLAEALEVCGWEMPADFLGVIRAGESSGTLSKALSHYRRLSDWRSATKQRLKRALVYPSILLSGALALIAALFGFVIPRLAQLLHGVSAGGGAAEESGWLMTLCEYRLALLFLPLVPLAGLVGLFLHRGARRTVLSWIERIPPFCWARSDLDCARFCWTIASMLGAGVTLIPAIRSARGVLSGAGMRAVDRWLAGLVDGREVATGARAVRFFQPLDHAALEVCHRTGRLRETFEAIAHRATDRLGARIDRLLSLVQPLAVMFVGIVVAGVGALMLSVLHALMGQFRA